MNWLKSWWRRVKARLRLDLQLVCELSKGDRDYHDAPDDEYGFWMCHMTTLTCVRCGKEFTV